MYHTIFPDKLTPHKYSPSVSSLLCDGDFNAVTNDAPGLTDLDRVLFVQMCVGK